MTSATTIGRKATSRSGSFTPLRRTRSPSIPTTVAEALEPRQLFAAFVVSNTNLLGDGSLVKAIQDLNLSADATNEITFNFPTTGVTTFLAPGLPEIKRTVNIVGLTDALGNPLIELNGTLAGGLSSGLIFNRSILADDNRSSVSGLIINRFPGDGIAVFGDGKLDIYNCRIGTDAAGNVDLGNGGNGIFVFAPEVSIGQPPPILSPGANSGYLTLVSGNARGIAVLGSAAHDVQITRCRIGTNLAGTAALGNDNDGITVGEGAENVVISSNLISGNANNAVTIGTTSEDTTRFVTVGRNLIGTNAAGTATLGNGQTGVNVLGARLVDIGAPDGLLPIGASLPGEDGLTRLPQGGNLISASKAAAGVAVAGNLDGQVRVRANLIGTDISGTQDFGNAGAGVFVGGVGNTVGGFTPADRNIISGNGFDGVVIEENAFLTQNNRVIGNYIGTDITGTQPLGNDGDGVLLSIGNNNSVGGTEPGAGNVIAFNLAKGEDGHGVNVLGTTSNGNFILGNSIFGNAQLGINLNNDNTPTPNDPLDADPFDGNTGPNGLQNFPVINSAVASAAGVAVQGVLDSQANKTYRVELFASREADPSGFGEGETFLGFVNVTTDAAGHAEFNTTTATAVPAGRVITATATDTAQNNTSEFSAGVTAQPSISDPPPADLSVQLTANLPAQAIGNQKSKVKATVIVTNVGVQDIAGSFTVQVFFVPTGSPIGPDSPDGTAVKTLRLRQGRTARVKVKIPFFPAVMGELSQNSRTLLARVTDPVGGTSDSPTGPATLIAEPFVNLVPTITSSPSGNLAFPQQRAAAVLENQGNVAFEGDTILRLLVSTDLTRDPADTHVADIPLTVKLKPDASKRLNLRFELPNSIAGGPEQYLVAWIDPDDQIPEGDENDNTFVSTVLFALLA